MDEPVTSPTEWSAVEIGYLGHVSRGDKHWGGLLVVDIEGDPVDFAWTESVEVSAIVRPLFGDRLASTLVSKTFAEGLVKVLARGPDVLCLDEPSLLARNVRLHVPLAVLAPGNTPNGGRWVRTPLSDVRHRGRFWFAQRGEEERIQSILQAAGKHFSPLGLDEPFLRVRQALEERAESEEAAE
ncbi:MAG TPA: hypothetical protein VLK65_24720 [Vicinamibacteria bacterium]|nr:hypothetical protein [Vicinamibacteria bacterium]